MKYASFLIDQLSFQIDSMPFTSLALTTINQMMFFIHLIYFIKFI